jgi:hypothetical protein
MNTVNHLPRLQFRTVGYSDKKAALLKGDRISIREIKTYPRLYWINGRGERSSVQSGEWNLDILEEFANCSGEPDDILSFTRRYGSLITRLRLGEKRRTTFKIADWRHLQRQYQETWEQLRQKTGKVKFPIAHLQTVPGEQFNWWFSNLSYQTANLYRLLLLELYSIPRHRLRKCGRDGCKTPYFIADHLSRKYCNACKRQARLESKRKAWQKNKQRWRR